jgi:hypothetical protein
MNNFCFIMSFLTKQFFYCRILLMSIHFYVYFIDLILLNLRYDCGVKIYAKLFWYATYAGTCAVFRNHNLRCFTHSWLLTWFVKRVKRRVPPVEMELFTLPEHLSSPSPSGFLCSILYMIVWHLIDGVTKCICMRMISPNYQLKYYLFWLLRA